LLNQPLGQRVFDPIMYLSASHEVFGITLAITWAITLVLYPEQILQHPARPIIGSFNPCFGWDYPPASYVALVLCSVNVYLTWRYAWLERTRTRLRNPGTLKWHESFSNATCILLALASNCWLLLWVLGPQSTGTPRVNSLQPAAADDVPAWMTHTGLFVFYALSSYLASLGNYLDSSCGGHKPTAVRPEHTIFIFVYGCANVFLFAAYVYDLVVYEPGQPPALPPWVTQSSDVLWMLCVMCAARPAPHPPTSGGVPTGGRLHPIGAVRVAQVGLPLPTARTAADDHDHRPHWRRGRRVARRCAAL
jgi:hypothetical protein